MQIAAIYSNESEFSLAAVKRNLIGPICYIIITSTCNDRFDAGQA